jgi:hypothetical protein
MNKEFIKWVIENCYILHDHDLTNNVALLHFTMHRYNPNLLLFNIEYRIFGENKCAEKASNYRLPNLPLHLRTKYLAS